MGATGVSLDQFNNVKNNLIHYNLEQIIPSNYNGVNNEHLDRLKIGFVWDYSKQNIKNLKDFGIVNVEYVPIGYHESMKFIKSDPYQDIDVLFYGFETPRRTILLEKIKNLTLNVVSSNILKYNDKPWDNSFRNNLISRSKVVLNLHAYPHNNIFEMVRVSHLLANEKAVVAEITIDTEINNNMFLAVLGGEIHELPLLCKVLVNNKELRKTQEEVGFKVFSKHRFEDYIHQGLISYKEQYNV
jgi:hypothetical protein